MSQISLYKSLASLLQSGDTTRIAYLGTNETTKQFMTELAVKQDLEFQDLTALSHQRWSFGGEYFEAIVIEDESFVLEAKKIRAIKKALQKNRNLILLSRDENEQTLREKLEPFGFSDFCSIVEDNVTINLTKKWFTFEQ